MTSSASSLIALGKPLANGWTGLGLLFGLFSGYFFQDYSQDIWGSILVGLVVGTVSALAFNFVAWLYSDSPRKSSSALLEFIAFQTFVAAVIGGVASYAMLEMPATPSGRWRAVEPAPEPVAELIDSPYADYWTSTLRVRSADDNVFVYACQAEQGCRWQTEEVFAARDLTADSYYQCGHQGNISGTAPPRKPRGVIASHVEILCGADYTIALHYVLTEDGTVWHWTSFWSAYGALGLLFFTMAFSVIGGLVGSTVIVFGQRKHRHSLDGERGLAVLVAGYFVLWILVLLTQSVSGLLLTVAITVLFVVASHYLARLLNLGGLPGLGLRILPAWQAQLGAGFAAGALLVLVGAAAHRHLGWYNPELLLSGDLILRALSLLVFFACVALTEELLCRGYLVRALPKNMPRVYAAVISGILFVALHLTGLSAFQGHVWAFWFFAGVAYCIPLLITRSLWISVGMHWGYNVIFVLLFQSGGPIYMLQPSAVTLWVFIAILMMPVAWLLATLFNPER
jgi:uncharacterized protein